MRRFLLLSPLALLFTLTMAGAAEAASYPNPPPDFSHSGDPHTDMYSFKGGQSDRPMLVIYAEFDDVPYPSGQDASYWADRFFGGFPSVTDYFIDNSFGDLILSPAAETDASNGGSKNDGVVSVSIDMDKGDFLDFGRATEAKMLLEEADPFVDFSDFDANGDGEVTNLEIVVHRLDTDPDETGGCGTTRGVDPVELDGVDIVFETSNGGTDTNLMTLIHETGHVAFGMRDLYRAGVGKLDIAGPTCSGNPLDLRRVTAWQSFHLGWSRPFVVTRDGFADVNASNLAGESFVLYDPDVGTDDYYVVEARIRDLEEYEETTHDTGLVIWKIDESLWTSGSNEDRPIDLQRPDGSRTGGCTDGGGCYAGSNDDAWDPLDSGTPERTFAPASGPQVAVRAIPGRSGSMRVFFDVRGPGVLVDPMTEKGRPMRVDVTPEELNRISVTVMNTGEETDSFEFLYEVLPAGWTSGKHELSLDDHEEATARASLTPAADAATGLYEIAVVGRSETDSSVGEHAFFEVNVVLDETALSFTGDTSVPTGEPASFRAAVSNPDDPGSPPVEGAQVTFELSGTGGTQTAAAVSGVDGIASVSPELTLPPGEYDLTLSTERVGKHAPASITLDYTIERRPTLLVWEGTAEGDYSDPAAAAATLYDGLSGSPLGGMELDLAIGTQPSTATTLGNGLAFAPIVLDQPAGAVAATASFAGNGTYLPSSTTEPFAIEKETLAFVYSGDTFVGIPAVPTLAAEATEEEEDDSPGDLALATARFSLAPTLTEAAFHYPSSVDGSGQTQAAATGLPVDLWSVTVSVPAANPYWEGATGSMTELALFDGARELQGFGRGPDAAGDDVQLWLANVRFDGTAWTGGVRLRTAGGTFEGGAHDWAIVVDGEAILQVQGLRDGIFPATLRLRITDGGTPGAGTDAFAAELANAFGPAAYSSGPVSLRSGNLRLA